MPIKKNIYFVVVLLVHIALAAMYISVRDTADDEPSYIEYSKRWLHGSPERVYDLDDSKTPVTAIAWLPRITEQLRHRQVKYNDWGKSDQQAGRYMMVFFTLFTALYIYVWGKKILGPKWAILPVALFLFDPLVLGHSGIIGSDMASAACYTALLYHLWQYLVQKKWSDILLVAMYTGLACITKQNLVLLVLIVPLICFFNNRFIERKQTLLSKKKGLMALVSIAIVWFIINVAFQFHGSLQTLASYHFESSTFKNLQQHLAFFSKAPLLLPEPFIKGFDMVQHHAAIGGGLTQSTYNGVFVWGQANMHHGFWYYYFAMGIFKMPIPIILLLVLGFVTLVLNLMRSHFKINSLVVVLLLPMILFGVLLSLFNPFQIGIRHIIFLLPSMYLLLSIYIRWLARKAPKNNWVLGAFALWQTVSTVTYFNNYIAYTNEFALNKTSIVEKISDSSIDYGQNSFFVKKYLTQHPEFKLPDTIPSTGKFAVRAVKVLHIDRQEADRYAWLRKNYKPYGNYKGTIWLYDIGQLKQEQQ